MSIEAGRSNGTVSLAVRDTGVGLAADELSRVFDLFYQVPARPPITDLTVYLRDQA